MAIIAISRSKQSRNLDSCYRVIKSFRIWLTSSCHQIYHLMFKNKTDRVATISTWIRGCYIEHWRNYCSTLLHCFMIATFHQLNAYVQIAQIPSSPSKRLSRRLVNIFFNNNHADKLWLLIKLKFQNIVEEIR